MKAGRLTTPLLAAGAIAIVLLVSDFALYAKGSRSFLLGRKAAQQLSQSSLDDKISKIATDIVDLSTRLSKIEQSVTKLDKGFERKVVFPLRRSYTGNYDELEHGYGFRNDKRIPGLRRINRMRPLGESSQMSLKDRFGLGSRTSNTFRRPEDDESISESRSTNELSPSVSQIVQKQAIAPSPSSPQSSGIQVSTNQPFTRNEHSFGPSGKSHHLLPGFNPVFKINIDELFPDITKEDPIVELKRFHDAESFQAFQKNMRENKVEKNDGSSSSFYKMSDILGFSNGKLKPIDKNSLNIKESINSEDDFKPIGTRPVFEHEASEKSVQPGQVSKPEAKGIDNMQKPKIFQSEVIKNDTIFDDFNSQIDKPIQKGNDKKDADLPLHSFISIEHIKGSKQTLPAEQGPSSSKSINDPEALINQIVENELQVANKSSKSKGKDCEEYEDPSLAFKSGKCVFKSKALERLEMPNEETIKSEKTDDLLIGSKDLLSQIKSSISNMEAIIKEPRRAEEKTGGNAKESAKKTDLDPLKGLGSSNKPENIFNEIDDLAQQIQQTRTDLMKTGEMAIEDEIDKVIQKPTNQQVI